MFPLGFDIKFFFQVKTRLNFMLQPDEISDGKLSNFSY